MNSAADDPDMDTGIHTGATMEIGSGQFKFETGVLYNQMGAKFEGWTVNLDYLQVPALAKFYTQSSASGFFLKTGLVGGILLNAEAKTDYFTVSMDRLVNDYDLQAQAGIGFLVPSSSIDLIIDFSYSRSIVSIDKEDDSDIYNQGVMLSTGIAL